MNDKQFEEQQKVLRGILRTQKHTHRAIWWVVFLPFTATMILLFLGAAGVVGSVFMQ